MKKLVSSLVVILIIWVSYYDLVFAAILALISIAVIAINFTHSDPDQKIVSVQNLPASSVQNAGIEHSTIDPTGLLDIRNAE